jgi:hypothetical protein
MSIVIFLLFRITKFASAYFSTRFVGNSKCIKESGIGSKPVTITMIPSVVNPISIIAK